MAVPPNKYPMKHLDQVQPKRCAFCGNKLPTNYRERSHIMCQRKQQKIDADFRRFGVC